MPAPHLTCLYTAVGAVVAWQELSASLMYVTPQFTTSDPLRSGSTGFEAGQRIQFQSRSADLNSLLC